MKRLLCGILVLMGLVSFSSCVDNNGYIVDWAPVEITIAAFDADGNSIISPEMPGMSLTFKGETYTVKEWGSQYEPESKAYLAIMAGLLAKPIQGEGGQCEGYQLWFGEIDGAADMDEDIVLNWPDGSRDVIHYHCSDHREWPSPKCNRSWKLNGGKHGSSHFEFNGKSLPN
ncbi:MAG: hypothetical protein J5835_02620 [Bacteroidales bacterium]|nr:hypothetical protein [Bacteroidales bacterium]